MNSRFFKAILLLSSLILIVNTGFCQKKIVTGFIVGSGLPDLSIGYTQPNWTLGGVRLLKPLSLGAYGEYAVSKQVKTGLDLTYYRLPLEVSDGRGNVTFVETFSYVNVAPYIAYEPVKWCSFAFNFSIRPLLAYSPKEFPPTATLLSYYGPRLTIKPIKQIGIDLGYEKYSRPFASARILGDVASLANTMTYINIRFTPFIK